ncbi:hypothetical protein N0V90_009389 [Kalmusia sp. IMI 367209]|nr:hypothetical protein N0V90_009389 [Kalmusia sp. IMI 367209]
MATSTDQAKAHFSSPIRLGGKDNGLAYHIFNAEGTESIIFLHGAGTGAPEWDIIIPHFSKHYHLLVPDLPLHNKSTDVELDDAAKDTGDLLRDLIKSEAKQGQVHVVGLSLGAYIGRRLAVQCPEVVRTCFLSGFNRVDIDWLPLPLRKCLPHLVYGVEYVGSKIPRNWVDGIEHTDNCTTSHNFSHFKKIWALIDDEDMRDKAWRARTLMVAGTKGGLIPTNDSIKDAQYLASLAHQENSETIAVQNKTMRHAWNRQDPKLFAEAVMCWIESKPLPKGFEPI